MEHKQSPGRRNFIANSVKGSIALGVGMSCPGSLLTACSPSMRVGASMAMTGFDQKPLPYKYDALENIIDAMTMEIHYSKHAAAYSTNLKAAATAEGVNMNDPLFWQCMRPKQAGNAPIGNLQLAISKAFGSFDDFKKQFGDAGKNRFGSGWAWLYADNDKNLKIGSSANQDNPLMDISDIKGFPLLGLDVWEHAYYLKYQNKRADYVDNWWNVVNWDFVQARFDKM